MGPSIFNGEEAESVVLIGGGVGITPMMSAARYLTETGWPGKVTLILGFRTPRDFIFRDEIAELEARNPNLSVTVDYERARQTSPGMAGTGTSMRRCSLQRCRILRRSGRIYAARHR